MKSLKKLLSIALVLTFVLALIPMTFTASADTWDGTSVATAFESGDGSEANPYVIKNAAQFLFFAQSVNGGEAGAGHVTYEGKFIKLDADINLNNKQWVPIGHSGKDADGNACAFSGTFDGNNHTISGLYFNEADKGWPTTDVGLFGRIKYGTIKNLTVFGSEISGARYAGGLVGRMTHGSSVINCYVKIDNISGEAVGGVVGRSQDKSDSLSATYLRNIILLCEFEGLQVLGDNKRIGNTSYAGGIVGVAGDTDIRYCVNNADVHLDAKGAGSNAGGIVGCHGASSGTVLVDHCINVGNISHTEKGTIGGVVGKANHVEGGSTNYNINLGTITTDGSTFLVGALVGNFAKNAGVAGYHHNVSVKSGENIFLEGSDDGTQSPVSYAAVNDDFYMDKRSCLFIEGTTVKIADLKGYSSEYWTDGEKHPEPKKDAILAKVLADLTWRELAEAETPVTTAPEVTTEAPGTSAPEVTTEAKKETTKTPDTSKKPDGTKAPGTTEAPKKEGGCGSAVASSLALIVAVSLAGVMIAKKKD